MQETTHQSPLSLLRRIRRIVFASWICFLAWSCLYYAFWRFDITLPCGWYAALSLVSVIGLAVWLGGLCFNLFCSAVSWRCHIAIVGWLLIGTSPLGFFGANMLHGALTFRDRRPEDHAVYRRVANVWLSSFLHANAHARLWIYQGKNAVLVNQQETAASQKLLSEMDQHIFKMCELLGAIPPSRIAWMRASFFSFDSMAIGPWAVSKFDQDSAELTSLDRHEAAHAVIFVLSGRDQDPPRVLVEGWAESQSNDRDTMITSLHNNSKTTRFIKINDLLHDQWYRASRDQVYSYGGPFVTYLLERFGGPRFLSFYKGVRKETFRDDVQGILDISWDDLEHDFWKWLKEEAERINQSAERLEEAADAKAPTKIEFANDAIHESWVALKTRYSQMSWIDDRLPENLRLSMAHSVTASIETESAEHEVRLLIERGDFYAHCRSTTIEFHSNDTYLARGDQFVRVQQHDAGKPSSISAGMSEKPFIMREICDYFDDGLGRNTLDPGQRVPLRDGTLPNLKRFRIEELSRPGDGGRIWHMRANVWFASFMSEASGEPKLRDYWLDEQHDLALVKLIEHSETDSPNTTLVVNLPQSSGELFPYESEWAYASESNGFTYRRKSIVRELTDRESEDLKRLVESKSNAARHVSTSRWYDYVPAASIGLLVLGIASVTLTRFGTLATSSR